MDFEGLEEVAAYEGKQFVTDLEGPVTKNENVLELCDHFIEKGQKFFSIVSAYEDFLSNVLRRQGCKTGDAFRFVLPFLKAYGATDNQMHSFSKSHITVVPGADKTMRFAQELMASFIVSAGYEHYVSEVCERIGFPFENTYCTRLTMEAFKMDDWEVQVLKNYAREIAHMPMITVPSTAHSLRDLDPNDQVTVARLDEIFWQEMSDLPAYRFLIDVTPVGGDEKASSIVDICKKTGVGTEDTMYIGDGTTDVQALQLIKRGGGLPIAFNGNGHALRDAEIAVLTDNTVITSVLVEAFYKSGKEGVMTLVENWSLDFIKQSGIVHDYLVRELARLFPERLPKVVKVSAENLSALIEESARFREKVSEEGSSIA